jgi:phospholipid/cholesterol/gamma-HCH transport system substrate-binding protein
MKRSKSNNIKLGALVLITSLIFTFGIFKISGTGGWTGNKITIYADFSDVKGLLIGNNVRYSGITIGDVDDIQIISDTIVRVVMSLEENSKKYLKSNISADIATNGLVGNMLVNLSPGKGSAPAIKDGDFVMIKQTVEISEMLTTLSSANDKIDEISTTLLEITTKINIGNGTVSQLINDSQIASNLKLTTKNLHLTTEQLKASSESVNSLLSGISEGEGNLGYLLKDNSLQKQMSSISQNIDSLLVDRTEPILKNLESSSLAIYNTTKDLETIIAEIDKSDGLLGTIMTDTSISNDLRATLDNLNDGTKKFDENMEALQNHWLLRGFFKKKKKEIEKKEKD